MPFIVSTSSPVPEKNNPETIRRNTIKILWSKIAIARSEIKIFHHFIENSLLCFYDGCGKSFSIKTIFNPPPARVVVGGAQVVWGRIKLRLLFLHRGGGEKWESRKRGKNSEREAHNIIKSRINASAISLHSVFGIQRNLRGSCEERGKFWWATWVGLDHQARKNFLRSRHRGECS